VEKPAIAGDNRREAVGRPWTTLRTAPGSLLRPQAVESLHPRIHRQLTWPDGLSTVLPVETIWTTSQSPGCGRKKVTTSVERGRNPARIRTADVGPVAPRTVANGVGAARNGVPEPSGGGCGAVSGRSRTSQGAVEAVEEHPDERAEESAGKPGSGEGRAVERAEGPAETPGNGEGRPGTVSLGALGRVRPAAVSRS